MKLIYFITACLKSGFRFHRGIRAPSLLMAIMLTLVGCQHGASSSEGDDNSAGSRTLAASNVTMQGHSVNESFAPEGYKLVWGDEFDGNTLDSSKWMLTQGMGGYPDLKLLKDSSVLKVADGLLQMNAIQYTDPEDEKIKYATTYSVSTPGTMNFQYGYLEMCAKVPYKNGAWPSLWMKSVKDWGQATNVLVQPKYNAYMAEVDIFEVFSNEEKAIPNIHKWYYGSDGKGNGVHKQFSNNAPYYFIETDNLPEEYHVYGFEWTSEYMAMFVDGEQYMTYDITDNGNFDADGVTTDMSGFHDPMYILLNNHILTPLRTVLKEGYWEDKTVMDKDLPMEYSVDWIHLYQKPGVGALYTAK